MDNTPDLWARYIGEVRRTSGQATDSTEATVIGALGICGETAEVAEIADDIGMTQVQGYANGANREAGGVADVVKKMVFHGREDLREKLVGELGDVFWYLALMMDALNIPLVDVLEYNISKLRKRYPDGFSTERSIQRADES